ncbi:hypothetical protein AVEN_96782-1 [Araneus ventricosus]|uniref:Chitin-binding type-2 domain-containing protein n=1 Tax=Araneus ventricosus TaxID=182803 RepID=A0A4Y2ILH9_ARAVE|nr:hypothetical protein AVEN_96782-1 [Araneus ventricosus]
MPTAAYGFVCPPSDSYTFHGDVSTGCQVYFMCYKGQKTSLRCKNGFAFDDSTSRCSDASEFACGNEQLIRNKRSDVMVHSISKVKAKENALELFKTITTEVKDTLKEVVPSVYDSLEENYVPILKSIKDDILPIVKHNILPKAQKAYAYTKNLEDRIFKKLCQSWELSNSTHINLVSFSDIASDVSHDLKPVIQLGRYFSSRMTTTRVKRSPMMARSLFDSVASFVQPVIKVIFKSMATAVGGDDPFMKDYALPMLFEILDDWQSTLQIREIVWRAKKIFSPVAKQIFSGRQNRDASGVTYMVATPDLTKAIFRFYTEVEPIGRDIVKKHLQMILLRTGQNLPVITDALERLSVYAKKEAKELKHDLLLFFTKYSEFFMTNNASVRNVHTFVEMSNEWMPIKRNVMKVFTAYLSHSPNSLLNLLFNRNSALHRL